jgi:hypothetical protein
MRAARRHRDADAELNPPLADPLLARWFELENAFLSSLAR